MPLIKVASSMRPSLETTKGEPSRSPVQSDIWQRIGSGALCLFADGRWSKVRGLFSALDRRSGMMLTGGQRASEDEGCPAVGRGSGRPVLA